jgi:hypothetical protein
MEQGTLFGDLVKEDGQRRVLANCSTQDPGWVDQAFELVCLYARHRDTFTSDDVRSGATHLPPPPHHNAWGAVFSKAAKLKIIRRCGHAKARHVAAHGRWVGVWCAAGASF